MSISENLNKKKDQNFRTLVTRISQKLHPEALKELKFQCRGLIKQGKLERIKNLLDLFTALEEQDVLHADCTDFLALCLRNINRLDLERLVNQYQEEVLQMPVAGHSKTV